MLELTRRMTVKRNHFSRIAGCYVDADGDFEGSFNTAFPGLSAAERDKKLKNAKVIPFAASNEKLREVRFSVDDPGNADLYRLLMGIRTSGLKNDALLEVFYDLIMDKYQSESPYAIIFYHGAYDIPRKSTAKEYQYESDEVYEYIICTINPLLADYELADPEAGFLFPAFSERCADLDHIYLYGKEKMGIF